MADQNIAENLADMDLAENNAVEDEEVEELDLPEMVYDYDDGLGRLDEMQMLEPEENDFLTTNWNFPGTYLDHVEIIKSILPYLPVKDMSKFRELSFNWKHAISNYPKFQTQLKGKLRDQWYRQAEGLLVETCLKWNSVEMRNFQYRRYSDFFKVYWHHAASLLDTLTIYRCSLECDGFIFILSHCPVLRTLTLDNCSLRDVEDYHSEEISTQTTRRRLAKAAGGFSEEPRPVTTQIQNLNFKSITKIEQCFMNYLLSRVRSMQTFRISECFYPPKVVETEPIRQIFSSQAEELKFREKELETIEKNVTKHFERYDEFERNVMTLLEQNAETLTHFDYILNNYYTSFLGMMAARVTGNFRIPFLTLHVKDPHPNLTDYGPVLVSFLEKCEGVRELVLKFEVDIPSQVMRSMLISHRSTLQKLHIGIPGDKMTEMLDLDFLNEFEVLADLQIEDTKPLTYGKIRQVIGGTRMERIDEPNHIPNLIAELTSKINPNFLNTLPPTLRKLGLTHFLSPIQVFHPIEMDGAIWQSIRNLTKLEINGPWMTSLNEVIQAISLECQNLITLTLSACGLEDVHLAGTNDFVVGEIYRCMLRAVAMMQNNPPPQTNELDEAVYPHINLENTEIEFNYLDPRPRLSDLPNLRNLDLSFNTGISDVTLFDALRNPGIKSLSLHSNYRITDDGLRCIAHFIPELEVLNVKHCRKLTPKGINQVVELCPKLKSLHATKTQAFGGRKGQGCCVECRNPNHRHEIRLHPRYADLVVVTAEKYVQGFPHETS